MVDRRNSTHRQLNRLAHLLLRVNGELASAPDRDLHVDGYRKAYVRKGALGPIVAVHADRRDPTEDSVTVDFDGIGRIDIPRSIFDHHRTPAGRPEAARLHRAAARRQRPGARHRRHLAPRSPHRARGTLRRASRVPRHLPPPATTLVAPPR